MQRLLHLEFGFPKLFNAGYEKTSDETGHPLSLGSYNCIAWAAEDTRHGFWWPNDYLYWPWWIKREDTVACFVKTFRSLGYQVCLGSGKEFLFHKLALYAIHRSHNPMAVPNSLNDLRDWEPTHMARQLPDGSWTSKCGPNEDITHFTLDALESYGLKYGAGDEYGCPVVYMKRLIPVSWIVHLLQSLQWEYERALDRFSKRQVNPAGVLA